MFAFATELAGGSLTGNWGPRCVPTSRRILLRPFFQQLQITLKTHKDPGKVAYRAIHSSCLSPFKPGMRYGSLCLKGALLNIPHLLKDSFDLVGRLSRRTFPPKDLILVKADIKDFFMSGQHTEILEACAKHAPEDSRASFTDMATFILGSQYVSVPLECGSAWHVKTGSGMGLSCSGDLSNLTFWERAERGFTDSPDIRTKFMIFEYLRFYDDIFIVARDGGGWKDFLKELSLRASFFKVELEGSSTTRIQMLDVSIYLGARYRASRKLDFVVCPKQTSIAVPLLPSSCHPTSVHRSWPRSTLQRCTLLSNDRMACRTVKEGLLARWSAFDIQTTSTSEKPVSSRRQNALRIIIPFSRVWGKAGLAKHFRSFERRWMHVVARYSLEVPHRIGIAWSLAAPHLVTQIRKGQLAEDLGSVICNRKWFQKGSHSRSHGGARGR